MFRCVMLASVTVGLLALPVFAQHEGDVVVGRSAAGQLKIEADLSQLFLLPPSPPDGWVDNKPGFDHLPSDEPGEDFYALGDGAMVQLVLVSKDPGLRILQQVGIGFDEVLTSALLGDDKLHEHLVWWIDDDIVGTDFEGTRAATFYLHDAGTTAYGESDPFTLTFTNTDAVPEPLTLSLIAVGGIGLVLIRRRRWA